MHKSLVKARWPMSELPDTAAWQALAARALEPSAPASHAFASAAMEHLPDSQRPVLHVLEDAAGGLRCVAPLRHERLRWHPWGRMASSRWGDFFFFGVPLVDADAPQRALHDLFDGSRRAGLAVLEFCEVPAQGAFMQALRDALGAGGRKPVELARWQRAVLDARRTPEEWWRQDIGKKRRKEWSRLKRKLMEQGELVFEVLANDAGADELAAWMDDFLQLESAGWKGRAGTALACTAHNSAFSRAMMMNFHREGNLRFWRLRLQGRTIASMFGFIVGDVLWLGKIAHDEDAALRRFSPGVLLTIETTRDILADDAVRFADSSADPNHPMIDHIWKQRLELVDVLVPLPGVSVARFTAIAATERAYRAARAQAKRLWHRLRRR